MLISITVIFPCISDKAQMFCYLLPTLGSSKANKNHWKQKPRERPVLGLPGVCAGEVVCILALQVAGGHLCQFHFCPLLCWGHQAQGLAYFSHSNSIFLQDEFSWLQSSVLQTVLFLTSPYRWRIGLFLLFHVLQNCLVHVTHESPG